MLFGNDLITVKQALFLFVGKGFNKCEIWNSKDYLATHMSSKSYRSSKGESYKVNILKKTISYFEFRRFREKTVFNILKCNTHEEVENILDSLNFRDRKWIINRVRTMLEIEAQNKMIKESKKYKRSMRRWKHKFIMNKFEKVMYNQRQEE